jgi:UDP-arabinose 4-epimerase
MTSILVTGGAGFIGSHTCKALRKAGFAPVSYDNLSRGNADAVKWGELVAGVIAEGRLLRETLARHRPAAVVHFAAFAYVGESTENPALYYRNNVAGTLALLEAMRDCGVGPIVFSSSSSVYGVPAAVPISEASALAPVNPYGATKAICERMLRDFAGASAMRWMALRYFNAAGADPDGEIGERHVPETHVIPLLLDAAAGARDAFTVFGTDYPTPDGSCIRDYVHVADLADAHVLALRALLEGAESEAINIGNGRGCSVLELVASARQVTGRAIPVRLGPRRAGDPPVLISDPRRARAAQLDGALSRRGPADCPCLGVAPAARSCIEACACNAVVTSCSTRARGCWPSTAESDPVTLRRPRAARPSKGDGPYLAASHRPCIHRSRVYPRSDYKVRKSGKADLRLRVRLGDSQRVSKPPPSATRPRLRWRKSL